jgi:hypothetical protein
MDAIVNVTGNAPAKFVPKIVKQITLPLFKIRAGDTIYVKVIDKAYRAAALKKPSDDPNKLPPMLLNVVNLESGELGQIIPGEILMDLLNDTYPSDGYVKKGFMIKVGDQKASAGGGGKRYNTYSLAEIELPEAMQDKPATASKK